MLLLRVKKELSTKSIDEMLANAVPTATGTTMTHCEN